MAIPTAEDLAEYLGVVYDPADVLLVQANNAAVEWAERRRSNTDPVELWESATVVLGTLIYGGLRYASRAQPQGFPGVDELGSPPADSWSAELEAGNLVGADPVIA